jgi:adenylosuccinate lyase
MVMHERYQNPNISHIWSDENKLNEWQNNELVVIHSAEEMGLFPQGIYQKIATILKNHPIDIFQWKEFDEKMHHDLNAFVAERSQHLPVELKPYFHKKITSYDTEEPAFVRMLKNSYGIVEGEIQSLLIIIMEMSLAYRYTIMNGRTHGQEAELQTFGKRCLTWLADLKLDLDTLNQAAENLAYAKLSGAIGNYGSLSPEMEKRALAKLGLEPYYGATQIMPREIYSPLAQALTQIVCTLDKIALAIRLGARSGNPIYQEPFKKTQTGSSAMPHKKNTIRTEQIEGMERMARGYLQMIMDNIKTWEERAIEQSCVERVAWPDLFQVTVHSLKVIKKVLAELKVYPQNMLKEIVAARGCYASSEAKEVLAQYGVEFGLTKDDCYRIVQLAAFNVFSKSADETLCQDFASADNLLLQAEENIKVESIDSIKNIIPAGRLKVSASLAAISEEVERWNIALQQIFSDDKIMNHWQEIFMPSYLLKNEYKLYEEILGCK